LNVDIAKELWIKGKTFSLENLLEEETDDDGLLLLDQFKGCSLVIARLAPQDYHRYHFPLSGTIGKVIEQGNALYSVNPISVRGPIDVYSENKRKTVCLVNEKFGKILYISIGATLVGSVNLTSQPGFVNKGDEHGYFAFGGSTILLLFQKIK